VTTLLKQKGGDKLMNVQWTDLQKAITQKELTSRSWKSDQASLLYIFEAANKMGIDPEIVANIDLCKLRTIIKEARRAIGRDDEVYLAELFHFAATNNMVDLRLKIGTTEVEEIKVEKRLNAGKEKFFFKLSQNQMSRIQQSTRLYFKFLVKESIEEQS
jgi:hypothetical protein